MLFLITSKLTLLCTEAITRYFNPFLFTRKGNLLSKVIVEKKPLLCFSTLKYVSLRLTHEYIKR